MAERRKDGLAAQFNESLWVCASLFCLFLTQFCCFASFHHIRYRGTVCYFISALETDWSAACSISSVMYLYSLLFRLILGQIDTKCHTVTQLPLTNCFTCKLLPTRTFFFRKLKTCTKFAHRIQCARVLFFLLFHIFDLISHANGNYDSSISFNILDVLIQC